MSDLSRQDVNDFINLKLADRSNITAEELREVDGVLLDYTEQELGKTAAQAVNDANNYTDDKIQDVIEVIPDASTLRYVDGWTTSNTPPTVSPAANDAYIVSADGTTTITGGSISVAAGGTVWWNGTGWKYFPPKDKFDKIVDVVVTTSTNLFTGSVESGYYNTTTGAPQVLSTWRRTTKFPLSASTQYSIAGYGSFPTGGVVAFCYDSGGAFISPSPTLTAVTGGFKFTTPAGTATVAFNISSNNDNGLDATFQVNLGGSVLPYQSPSYSLTEYKIKASSLPNYYNKTQVDALFSPVASTVQKVTTITGNMPTARVNGYENTPAPSAFPSATEISNGFAISTSLDTTSPVKDYVGYKRTFSSTKANGSTDFRTFSIPVGASRPSLISMAFWTKQADFAAIYSGTVMQVYLGNIRSFFFNPTTMLAGTPQTSTGAGTPTDINTATLTATKLETDGAWIRIRLTFSSITWQGSFAGTTIPYYFLFNSATQNNKSMDFVDFTVLLGEEIQAGIVYPDPNGNYQGNVITLGNLNDRITQNKTIAAALQKSVSGECSLKLTTSGKKLYFSSHWSGTHNLVRYIDLARATSFTSNPNSNINSEYLSLIGGDPTSVAISLKVSGDDITPANLNGSYIGGNHGWALGRIITKAAHGKTSNDVGSIYSDTLGKMFKIMSIVDANNFWLCSLNQATDGFTYTFIAPTGTLTYVSDGVNTAAISGYTQAALGNMWPMTSPSVTKVLINGKTEVSADGDYACDYIDIHESYDVYDLPSVLDKITINRPVGGYLTNPFFNQLGADKLFRHSIVYRLQRNGTTLIFHNFRTYKKLVFNFHGFTQSTPMASSNVYVPKTLPISDGTTTYDFTKIVNWSTFPLAPLNFTPTYWADPLSPPDRIVNISANAIYHTGYITDRGVGYSRKDNVIDALFFHTTGKMYLKAKSYSAGTAVNANEFFSCVAFRQFINPASFPAGRTNFAPVDLGDVVYLFADYHSTLSDSLPVEDHWKGRKIEVYEHDATNRVKVLSNVVTDSIDVESTATSTGSGYAVLKLT